MTDQPSIPRERIQLSHAKRLRGNPYNFALETKKKEQGGKNLCGHEGTQTLDHIDPRLFLCHCGAIHQDNSLENLRMICFFCNSAKGGPKPSNVEIERETRAQADAPVPTGQDTYSNHKAFKDQPKFRMYVFRAVLEAWLGHMTRSLESLVNDGSEFAKISVSTGYKWMGRLTSNEGPFKDPADTSGQLKFRKIEYCYLTAEELEQLFPCHVQVSEEQKKLILYDAQCRINAESLKQVETKL